jgi:hypothetical protein
MPDFLSEDELRRMVIAATNGETVVPSSPYAQQVWERVQREVAEIRSRPGAIVDLPSDIP